MRVGRVTTGGGPTNGDSTPIGRQPTPWIMIIVSFQLSHVVIWLEANTLSNRLHRRRRCCRIEGASPLWWLEATTSYAISYLRIRYCPPGRTISSWYSGHFVPGYSPPLRGCSAFQAQLAKLELHVIVSGCKGTHIIYIITYPNCWKHNHFFGFCILPIFGYCVAFVFAVTLHSQIHK